MPRDRWMRGFSIDGPPVTIQAPVAELPTGTVTLLFSDVDGSTELVKRLGEHYGDVLAEHRRLLRAAFAESRGIEIDTQGDAFFVAFGSARDAVAAAVAAQRALATHSWRDGVEVRVRMGLHTCEAHRSDIALFGPMSLAGVETHPDANLHSVAPRVRGERPLRCNGGRDGVPRTAEGDEKGVSLRVDLDAAALGERRPKKTAMFGKHVAVVLPQPFDELGRAIDVREEKGDGSGRQLGHWCLDRYRRAVD